MASQIPEANRGLRPAVDRFTSFAERYVIERAAKFTEGKELEEAWRALQDADKIYGMIQRHNQPDPEAQRGEGASAAALPSNVTSMINMARDYMTRGLAPPQALLTAISAAVSVDTQRRLQPGKGQPNGTP